MPAISIDQEEPATEVASRTSLVPSPPLFRREWGAGERVLVVLHGWSGDHNTALPLLDFRPEGWRVISFDLPGCGSSPAPSAWTGEAISEQLYEELRALNTPQMTILGNCSGANLLLPVLHRLDRVAARLVFLDPFAYTPWYFRLMLAGWVGRFIYWVSFANPLGRFLTNLSLRKHRGEGTDLTRSFEQRDHHAVHRYLGVLSSLGRGTSYQANPLPTHVLYGEKTFGAIRRSVAIWREAWPHATFVELKGAAHLPIQEATEQVASVAFEERPER